MGEASGFKLFKLFNSLGAGPPPPRPPPQDLNYVNYLNYLIPGLNMGEASGFKLFILFNSRPQLNILSNLHSVNNLNPGEGVRGGSGGPGIK